MERPEIRKYIDINSVNSPSIPKLEEYIELLNDYCDFIEWRNTQLKMQNAFMKSKSKRLKKLEKALDKACDELDFLTEEDENGDKWDSFLWKEWCLSDKDDVEKM